MYLGKMNLRTLYLVVYVIAIISTKFVRHDFDLGICYCLVIGSGE